MPFLLDLPLPSSFLEKFFNELRSSSSTVLCVRLGSRPYTANHNLKTIWVTSLLKAVFLSILLASILEKSG